MSCVSTPPRNKDILGHSFEFQPANTTQYLHVRPITQRETVSDRDTERRLCCGTPTYLQIDFIYLVWYDLKTANWKVWKSARFSYVYCYCSICQYNLVMPAKLTEVSVIFEQKGRAGTDTTTYSQKTVRGYHAKNYAHVFSCIFLRFQPLDRRLYWWLMFRKQN